MDKPPTRQGPTAGPNPRIGTTRSRATKNSARTSRQRSALWKTKPATTEFLKTKSLEMSDSWSEIEIDSNFKITRQDAGIKPGATKTTARIPRQKRGPETCASGPVCNQELACGRCCFLFDWGADQIAPLSPRAIVIFHVVVAQKIFQDEPGVRTAFADAAVGNHFVLSRYALAFIKRFQRFG